MSAGEPRRRRNGRNLFRIGDIVTFSGGTSLPKDCVGLVVDDVNPQFTFVKFANLPPEIEWVLEGDGTVKILSAYLRKIT
jgi:hypothetical protein